MFSNLQEIELANFNIPLVARDQAHLTDTMRAIILYFGHIEHVHFITSYQYFRRIIFALFSRKIL